MSLGATGTIQAVGIDESITARDKFSQCLHRSSTTLSALATTASASCSIRSGLSANSTVQLQSSALAISIIIFRKRPLLDTGRSSHQQMEEREHRCPRKRPRQTI